MKIVIMTTCYNASKYIKRCIDSVKYQKYKNYIMVITDDMSTDNSVSVIKHEINGIDNIKLIENTKKMYQPGNYWVISHLPFVEPEDILVTLDGDDWFPNDMTLDRVVEYYEKTKCLMCFGQFIIYHSEGIYSNGFTTRPYDINNIRTQSWTTSHLRTFKAKVFNSIKEEDLLSPTNNYWEVTGDQAIIFPMIEMCGGDNIHFTNDINYVYNCETELNDYKVNGELQRQYENLIRNKEKYQRKF